MPRLDEHGSAVMLRKNSTLWLALAVCMRVWDGVILSPCLSVILMSLAEVKRSALSNFTEKLQSLRNVNTHTHIPLRGPFQIGGFLENMSDIDRTRCRLVVKHPETKQSDYNNIFDVRHNDNTTTTESFAADLLILCRCVHWENFPRIWYWLNVESISQFLIQNPFTLICKYTM